MFAKHLRSVAICMVVGLGALSTGCKTPAAQAPAPIAAAPAKKRACLVSYGPALEPKSSAELVAAHGSSLDPYKREGGAWLAGAPVLVNRDFDFSLAMAMEDGLGAGLAAAQRMKANQVAADKLKDVQLPAELASALTEERRCGLHTYFLLWGSDKATLMLMSEVPGQGSPPPQLLEGAALPADDWTANVLAREMTALFERHQVK